MFAAERHQFLYDQYSNTLLCTRQPISV